MLRLSFSAGKETGNTVYYLNFAVFFDKIYFTTWQVACRSAGYASYLWFQPVRLKLVK